MMNNNYAVEKQVNNVLKVWKSSGGTIRPHFMLTGPSGSGKSHLINKLAEYHEVNFVEINAAQLTKEGTSGNSLSKALAPIQQAGGRLTIVFVDEFDKLFISGNNNSDLAHETTNGVQNEFLRILEADSTQVFGDYGKYNTVSCETILFIFAGAFNNTESIDVDKLRDFGIKTEFLGRVNLVYNLEKLRLESLGFILKGSKLFKDYLNLFSNVDPEEAHSCIMRVVEQQYEKNTLGVRMLHGLTHEYFLKGGTLEKEQVEKITFQTAFKLEDMQ